MSNGRCGSLSLEGVLVVIAPIPMIDWKAIFRKRAKATRAAAAKARPDAAKFAAAYFLETFAPKETARIALYYPNNDELDTWPLAEGLIEVGHTILLPVVIGKKKPLIFRRFEQGATLIDGAYGIKTPVESAEELVPDIVVTPLLGIRPDGARLGMGGGFYDRTLKDLRAQGNVLAIGYGYSAQQMERFPVDANDEFLDGFTSEWGAEHISRRR